MPSDNDGSKIKFLAINGRYLELITFLLLMNEFGFKKIGLSEHL